MSSIEPSTADTGPVRRVAIVSVGDSGEAHLLRAILEHSGLVVGLTLAGRPSDVFGGFAVFGGPADAAILAAHGDERGIVFPELADGVDTIGLDRGRITPATVTTHLVHAPPLVVSTACFTCTEAWRAAFAACGARTYVAADAPAGRDVPLLLGLLFHRLAAGDPIAAALAAANATVDRRSRFAVLTHLGAAPRSSVPASDTLAP